MAPLKSSKRASESSGPAAKRQQIQDLTIAQVTEAIQKADLTESCRKMLIAGCALALGDTADNRHESQALVVQLIGDVLKRVHEQLDNDLKREIEYTQQFESRMAELVNSQQNAQDVADAAIANVKTKKTEMKFCEKSLEVATKELATRRSEKRRGNAPMQQFQEDKEKYRKAKEEHLDVIAEGQSDDLASHQEALRPLFDELVLDESLNGAMRSSCKKKKSERAHFDNLVLEQLVLQFSEKIASIDKEIKELAPAAKESADLLEHAEKTFEEATSGKDTVSEELAVGKMAEATAKEELRKADYAVNEFEPEFLRATAARDEKGAELDTFLTLTVAGFEELKNRSSTQVADEGGA